MREGRNLMRESATMTREGRNLMRESATMTTTARPLTSGQAAAYLGLYVTLLLWAIGRGVARSRPVARAASARHRAVPTGARDGA
jgi:hypothetical protein